MRGAAHEPLRPGRALAMAVLGAAALALSATDAGAGADADPALRANADNLHELVERARRDVQSHTPNTLNSEHRRMIDREVRETARERLESHLANLAGRPHFDPIWTHYIVEGRRQVAPATRQYHLRACPICNVALKELGMHTGVSLPELAVPFASVQLGDAYFKVDPGSGRIYRIVDPIKGTPSYISTGRLELREDRWWVVNGTQRTGPIRTRDSTRLPWNIRAQAEATAAAPRTSRRPSTRRAFPSRSLATKRLTLTPRPAPATRPDSDATMRPLPIPHSASSARVVPLGRATSSRPAPPPAITSAPAPTVRNAPPTVPATALTPAPATTSVPTPLVRNAPPTVPATVRKLPATRLTPVPPPSREAILRRRPTGPSRAIPATELRPDGSATSTEASSSPSGGDEPTDSPTDKPAYTPFWQ